MKAVITLVTGGARSGKSRYAQELALSFDPAAQREARDNES